MLPLLPSFWLIVAFTAVVTTTGCVLYVRYLQRRNTPAQHMRAWVTAMVCLYSGFLGLAVMLAFPRLPLNAYIAIGVVSVVLIGIGNIVLALYVRLSRT